MQSTVETVVESLCQHGCKAVWGYIETLESGHHLAGTERLNDVQRQQVLKELKAIMSVYGATSCSIEDSGLSLSEELKQAQKSVKAASAH